MKFVRKNLIQKTLFSSFLTLMLIPLAFTSDEKQENKEEKQPLSEQKKRKKRTSETTPASAFSTPSSHRDNSNAIPLSDARRVSPPIKNNPFIVRDQEIKKNSSAEGVSPLKKKTRDTSPNKLSESWLPSLEFENLFTDNKEDELILTEEDEKFFFPKLFASQKDEEKEVKSEPVPVAPKKILENLYDKFMKDNKSNHLPLLNHSVSFEKDKKTVEKTDTLPLTLDSTTGLISTFSTFSFKDIAQASLVSKAWYLVARDPNLWFLNRLKDSRRPVKQLSYLYEQTMFDHRPWINTNFFLLKNFGSKFRSSKYERRNTNIALARINLIYKVLDPKTNELSLHEWSYDVPYFFISGWGGRDQRREYDELIATMLRSNPKEFEAIKSYKRFQLSDAEKASYSDIYQTRMNILMSHKILTSQLNPQQRDNDLKLVNSSSITHKFFHSEQTIASYFTKTPDQYIKSFISFINAKHKGMKVILMNEILDIFSYQDMCQRCGNRLFYDIENESEYTTKLKNILKGTSISLNPDFKYHVASSGIIEYPEDNGTYLRKYNSEDTIPVKNINLQSRNNFVAQYYKEREEKDGSK